MSETKKNYLKGSCKKFTFSDGNFAINLSLNQEQIQELESNKGYVQLKLMPYPGGEDKYGNHFYIVEDEWWKTNGRAEEKAKIEVVDVDPTTEEDDLPF